MKKIFSAFFIFNSLSAFAGGPWSQEKHEGYVQLSGTYIGYDHRYISKQSFSDLMHQVTDVTLQGYCEYGISNHLTLIANIPFKFQNIKPQKTIDSAYQPYYNGSLSGFGNISVAGKYQFLNKKIVAAAHLRIDINSFSEDESIGLRTGYPEYGIAPSLSIGKGGSRWFAYAEAGVTLRGENYGNQFIAKAEGGYKISKTYFIAVMDLAILLSDPVSTLQLDPFRYTALYNDAQSYTAFGLKINQELGKHLLLNLALYGAVGGSDVAAAPSFNLGIAYRW